MCDHEPKYARGLCRSCYGKEQYQKHYQSQRKSTKLVDFIKEDFDAGTPIAKIAEKHGKTESAVWAAAKKTIISYRSWYDDPELCDQLQSLDPEGIRWEPVANDNYTYGWKKA